MPVHLLDFNAGEPNRGVAALAARFAGLGRVRVHEVRLRAELPDARDGVWVLSGGPGSPLEDGPWRVPTLRALRVRLEEDRPTLAICYGFELLAAAAGARLERLETGRLGVWPLRLTEAGRVDAWTASLDGAGSFENRSWGVRDGPGVPLALGPEGDRVAVRFSSRIAGVIFHPEADDESVRELLHPGRPLRAEVDRRYGPDAARGMHALGVERVHDRILSTFFLGHGDTDT